MKSKNILFLVFLNVAFSCLLNAQHTLIINGLVSNNGGIPIHVIIEVDMNTTNAQNSSVLSDSAGHYTDTFSVSYSQGSVTAWIVDCNGDTVSHHGGYYINHMTLILNLDYCASPTTSCTALFSKTQAHNNHQQAIPYLIHVIDHSSGSNLSYLWHFGDGDSSMVHNPTHTYSGHGPYILCLTVSNSHCTDTYCDTLSIDSNGTLKSGQGFTIVVGGNIPTGIVSNSDNEYSIELFPNPANNLLIINNVEGNDIKYVQIVNLSGSEVYYTENVNNTIDVSSLNKGLYLIRIQNSEGEYFVQKFYKN